MYCIVFYCIVLYCIGIKVLSADLELVNCLEEFQD